MVKSIYPGNPLTGNPLIRESLNIRPDNKSQTYNPITTNKALPPDVYCPTEPNQLPKMCFQYGSRFTVAKSADEYFKEARTFYDLKKYEAALECLNKAIELNPNNPTFYNKKGNTLYQLGEYSVG